jgi:hypothetical protein
LIRKKRVINKFSNENEISFQHKSPLHKNIKKVYATTNYNKNVKKSIKIPKYIKLPKQILKLPLKSQNKNIAQITNTLSDVPIKVQKIHLNNYLNEIKNKNLPRQKRSIDQNYDYQIIENNGINRLNDPEINNIWNSITEDEQLLQEYNKKNNNIIQNLIETQDNIKQYTEPETQLSNNKTNLTIFNYEFTTQTNIESILIDAIPKFQTVISGGLKKVENLTESLENFISNFNNSSDNTTRILKDRSEDTYKFEDIHEKLSRNIFKTMVGSVRKFFDLISGIANIFHGQ